MRAWLVVSLLIFSSFSASGAAPGLHELVKAQMASTPKVQRLDGLESYAFESFSPIQSTEVRYSIGDTFEDERSGREQYNYRFNIKSFTEMALTPESRRLSRQLMVSSRLDAVAQSRFDSYLALVNHLISSRLHQVLETRRTQLQRMVDRYSQKLGQQKISPKDLLDDFRSLQKVEADSAAAKEQILENMPVASEDVVSALIDNVASTQKKLGQISTDPAESIVDRNAIEMRLDRINREIQWANDSKILDRVEYVHRTMQREDSFRIAFNVPFLRFDRENRSREQVLQKVKERELEADNRAAAEKLKRTHVAINSLAAQIGSVRQRFQVTQTMLTRLRQVQDLDLRAQLIELNSQLERDILALSQRYYSLYFEYLRDTGVLGRMDVDFLDAKWRELSK